MNKPMLSLPDSSSIDKSAAENNPANKPAQRTEKQLFFKMTLEQARRDYEQKLITAEAYILYIVKAHRSAGWKWTFSVKDFCKQWGVKDRTFYYALSKLKSKKLINWESEGKVTLWWGSDIGKCLSYLMLKYL